jgi:outer membrane protein TolC
MINRLIVFCLILWCTLPDLFSQSTFNLSGFDLSRDLQEQLPPIDTLMKIAHEQSPGVLKYSAQSRAEKEKIALAKKTWGNHIQLFTNYSFGNQGLVINGTTASDVNTSTNGYRAGVNLSVPINEILTRKNRIKLAEAEYESATWQEVEAMRLVDIDIVTNYQKLLLAHKQVRVNMEFSEKAAVSEQLAEKQLRDNQIKLSEYTSVSEIRMLAENRLFEAQNNFYETYSKLELLLGVHLSSLKR